MPNVKKNKQGYGYRYTDISAINTYLAEQDITYWQYVETDESGNDYIMTVPIIGDKELSPRRGCKIVGGALQGKTNKAQEYGSALTYARRYSLLMAFGLATEDDDGACLTEKPERKWQPAHGDELPFE